MDNWDRRETIYPIYHKQSVMWIRPENQCYDQKVTLCSTASKFAEISTIIIFILQQVHLQQGYIALSFPPNEYDL